MIRDQLHNSLRDALTAAGLPEPPNGIALNPADPDKGQGEWASPVAMQLARAAGAAPKEIAERLEISTSTAKYHLTSLLNKLGADNRTQAVAHATRQGFL